MNYKNIFENKIKTIKTNGNYRTFINLKRKTGQLPKAEFITDTGEVKEIINWCSNDYLGMGQNPEVLQSMHDTIDECGAGAGGTRNISGTNYYHTELEKTIANWYNRESALIFTSGYTANLASLSALGKMLDNPVIISDSKNHNSMIEGIKAGKSEKIIFHHSDMEHLESILKQYPKEKHKVIAFESVYSMDGDIAPIEQICDLADKYNALTYIDEVHAIALYGKKGCGVVEEMGLTHRLDIIQGTFGKGLGLIGGFVTGDAITIDFIRSFGNAFIFSTSLPPYIASGTIASINYIKKHNELRINHKKQANYLKQKLGAYFEVLEGESHIVPLMVRDSHLVKKASDLLLYKYGHYVQPINYPTVAHKEERLRFAPTPLHTNKMIDELTECCLSVWDELKILNKNNYDK